VFWLLAGVGIVLAVAGMIGMRETLPRERRQPSGIRSTLRTYGSLLRERTLIGLLLTGGFVFAQIFAYVSGSSFVLQNQYGLTTLQFGLVFGVNSLGLVIMSQVNPVLLRRRDPQDVLSVGLVISGVATVFLVVNATTGAFGLVGILIPLFVILSMAGLALPNVPGLALATHGRTAGSAAALLGGANFAVGAAVAPLVGVLPVTPAASMAIIMAAMSGAAILSYFWIARPGQIAAFDRQPQVVGGLEIGNVESEDRSTVPLAREPVGCSSPTG
jgi:DHA1 family bicyclomycin/chloramphenicol resistance-like MFS transporter